MFNFHQTSWIPINAGKNPTMHCGLICFSISHGSSVKWTKGKTVSLQLQQSRVIVCNLVMSQWPCSHPLCVMHVSNSPGVSSLTSLTCLDALPAPAFLYGHSAVWVWAFATLTTGTSSSCVPCSLRVYRQTCPHQSLKTLKRRCMQAINAAARLSGKRNIAVNHWFMGAMGVNSKFKKRYLCLEQKQNI